MKKKPVVKAQRLIRWKVLNKSSNDPGILSPPSHVNTRSGKARKIKDRKSFYKGYKGEGVVYLPGDINGLTKKLQLLAAEFLKVTPQSGTNWFMYWTHCLD